jgi:uncharacterized protein YndB with AHSA1/START domain
VPTVSRGIAAPPDVAWRLLTDLDTWPQWGPSVASASIDTDELRLGSRGTVATMAGVSLPFEVTRFEDGRRWSWKVAGVSATDHRVVATEEGCEVTFGVPWWAPGYLAVCAIALRRIEKLALR